MGLAGGIMESVPVKLPPNFDIRSNSAATEWKSWKCMFQDYLIGIGNDEASDRVKLSLLRNMMGPESTKVIQSFKMSTKDSGKYDVIIQEIEKYVNPKCNEVFERYKFNERKQEAGEKFDNFYTSLRQLIPSCNYTLTSQEAIEDQILRDRIVQGINDKSLQESLLRIENLTLDKAANVCRAAEISRSQVKEMNPSIEIDEAKFKRNKKSNFEDKKAMVVDRKFDCRRCQKRHGPKECPAYGKKCTRCGILNHFAISCRVRNVRQARLNESSESSESLNCAEVKYKSVDKSEWIENIKIEDQDIKCKLDSGADVSIMPKYVFDKINKKRNLKLHNTKLKIQSFTGENVNPLGIINLKCKFKDNVCNENFIVVESSTMLLGLPGCVGLNLIKRVNSVTSNKEKEKFIQSNIKVFEGIGRLPGKVNIATKSTVEQICHPSPRLPSCLLKSLKTELKRLEDRKSIVKVDNINENACVNRMVIVEKPNGHVRLCLDPSDLNKIIVKKPKTLPTLEDLSFKLQGKKFFSVLDLTEGFHHLNLSEESSWKCCFATPFGVYRYLVLPYGLMNAPELFQDVLESHFSDINNVVVWADDILVMGNSEQEHDIALKSVILKAMELGIVFNKDKFQYKQSEVKYVGQVFNDQGMSVDRDRVESLFNLKEPTNRDELRQILGSFNYVRRYVPDMANLMAPLCKLLKKDTEFLWLPAHRLAFAELKRKVCSAPSLTPFDSKKKIILQCDASKNGLGCCLFQQDSKNILKLVACASRTMNDSELNYSQTEKELLSICYAVKKFHRYIYGSDVDVQTDHKPIVSIMSKPICKIGSPRLKRLRLKLLMYNLHVFYVPGKLLHFADMLSRNSLNIQENVDKEMLQIVHKITVHLPMTQERKLHFEIETKNDSSLSLLNKYYKNGWPAESKLPKECRDFYKLKDDIYFETGLAFYGNKIIVPKSLRIYVLKLVHEGHPGICKCLKKARQLFYWPGLSKDIHDFIMSCRTCEKFRSANRHDKLLPHKVPNRRYAKVGTDILDFCGKFYLVIVDYFSHWLEILPLSDKTSGSVINAFQEVFSRFGYPEEIIADNNPFNSFECHKYYKSKEISLVTSSPHYPRSNGMAEKAVHLSKMILGKAREDRVDYRNYVLNYNNTPLSTVNVSPSQILNSRRVRTLIPTRSECLEPKVEKNIHKLLMLKKSVTEQNKLVRKKLVGYKVGDMIVHKTDNDKYWEKGIVVGKCKEPRSYWIKKGDDRTVRRNTKHLRKSFSQGGGYNYRQNYLLYNGCDEMGKEDTNVTRPDEKENLLYNENDCEDSGKENTNVTRSDKNENLNMYVTRSGRIVKPRQILDL